MDMKCHVQDAVQSVANNGIATFERITTDFFSTILNSLATFWVKPDTPVTLASSADGGQTWTDSKTVAFVHEKTLGLTLTIFTLAIVIAGIRMAWEQRAKPVQDLLKAMLTFLLVCGAGTAAMQLLIAWSDAFAVSVVQDAIGGHSFMDAMKNMVTEPSDTGGGLGNVHKSLLMMLLLGQVSAWASLIQIVLMLIRSAMLVLLGSTLPLAAAATNTEVGKAWFKKYCAWSLGFIAYKPAAALIYAAAIKLKQEKMLGPESSGLLQSLTGVMMMLLAIFALPALLRLAVPLTAAVGGGSAGMGSTGPEMGSLASGAVNVGPSSRSGSSAGASGGASGAGASSAGASGAATTGVKAAGGAALGPAGIAATAARKAAGAFAGAAAHSAGEAGGGSSGASMPRSSGSRSGGGRANSRSAGGRTGPSPSPKVPAGSTSGGDTGPSGNW
ncbi:type IV secretion system protein [Kribbella sp. VKM Ac-2569]|uniref:type IV secretion system protein n=1 Tax=Kribbella sp. VKM Ac-2569 TaxID=2512220 RepID=UPI0018E5110C|nr:type IV secretion system protein [Kribbella sp. VKM Ac-2569]